jgi:hypothetical protein
VDEAAEDPMVAFLDAILMSPPEHARAILDNARRWRASGSYGGGDSGPGGDGAGAGTHAAEY